MFTLFQPIGWFMERKNLFSFLFYHWAREFKSIRFLFQSSNEMQKNQILLQDGLVLMNISRVSDARGFVTSNFMAVAEIKTGKRRLKNVWHQQNLYENVKWWIIVRGDKIFRSVTNTWTNVEWYTVRVPDFCCNKVCRCLWNQTSKTEQHVSMTPR